MTGGETPEAQRDRQTPQSIVSKGEGFLRFEEHAVAGPRHSNLKRLADGRSVATSTTSANCRVVLRLASLLQRASSRPHLAMKTEGKFSPPNCPKCRARIKKAAGGWPPAGDI